MAAITTKVLLTVTLMLPDQPLVGHQEPMDNLAMCWAIARELTIRAEEGPLRILGGRFSAGCTVIAQPSQEH